LAAGAHESEPTARSRHAPPQLLTTAGQRRPLRRRPPRL